MPPRTRTAKSVKSMKENVGVVRNTKSKSSSKAAKPARKVLGDKTNSASDDNASTEIPLNPPRKHSEKQIVHIKVKEDGVKSKNENLTRPRRDRRIPNRFVESNLLTKINLSNNKADEPTTPQKNSIKSQNKENAPLLKDSVSKKEMPLANGSVLSDAKSPAGSSPFKTPEKVPEASLLMRPRRVSRLPSRFEDHSLSPSKFVPVQPCHASTPLAKKNVKTLNTTKNVSENIIKSATKDPTPKLVQSKLTVQVKTKTVKDTNKDKDKADNNNNAKGRTLRTRKPVKTVEDSLKSKQLKKSPVKTKQSPIKTKKIPVKLPSPVKYSYLNSNHTTPLKQNIPVKIPSPVKASLRSAKKDLSFKVLEDNKKRNSSQDVYEFIFDPNEEPAAQKTKKRVVKKKPSKPKTVIFKNNYDQNVNKALAALKKFVGKKPALVDVPLNANTDEPKNDPPIENPPKVPNDVTTGVIKPQIQRDVASKIVIGNPNTVSTLSNPTTNNKTAKSTLVIQDNIVLNANDAYYSPQALPLNPSKPPEPNRSVRVEDIAADFEFSPPHDFDYSPINSLRPKTPDNQINAPDVHNDDPLNLKENFSFDLNPVASSSMNTSVRQPHACPWRVEFGNLPIRWHVGSYVKPNMTPAVECSFVNFNDKQKKHVYTNIVPESDNDLPEIVNKDQPNMIQTSIISFIKEVVEKSSTKKNRARSVTPASSSLFNDIPYNTPDKENEKVAKATKQLFTPQKNVDKASSADNSKDVSDDKENSKDSSRGYKRKNNEESDAGPAKTPRKEKNDRYFGFDDSENVDQENVSPNKECGQKRSLRRRARAVLKEFNKQAGPTRAAISLATKNVRKEEVERLYNEMKTASDAPLFPAKETAIAGATNTVEPTEELDDDSQISVHLFEDVDIVHHLKPQRKSYGKAKKVTFRQGSTDSSTQDSDLQQRDDGSDDEEDLDDLTFDPGVPLMEYEETNKIKKAKKKRNKKKMTKKEKEEEEAEAWAAGFNSMCEDVEEFPLLVE